MLLRLCIKLVDTELCFCCFRIKNLAVVLSNLVIITWKFYIRLGTKLRDLE